MQTLRTSSITLASMLMTAVCQGAPFTFDFRTNGGPTTTTSTTYTGVIGSADINISSPENLYHDTTDGYGVCGSGYACDEVEASERLFLNFSAPQHLLSIGLTDLFNEVEPNLWDCGMFSFGCYLEAGAFRLRFLDGTYSPFNVFLADSNQTRFFTNGEKEVVADFENVVEIMFVGLGYVSPLQFHEFSLKTVTVDIPEVPEVPEPATLFLLGTGLIGLARCRRRLKL